MVSLKPRGKCLQRQVNSIKEGQDFGEPWVCKEEVGVAGEGTFSQVASGVSGTAHSGTFVSFVKVSICQYLLFEHTFNSVPKLCI